MGEAMAERDLAQAPASAAWVRRYLALLGVEHPRPSLEALSRLNWAHLCTVPFENASAILRRQACPSGPVPPLDPERLLDDWERGRGGGVCFELARMFNRLLVALGYDAHSVLAYITFPGSHQATRVELDGCSYLAEVSNGAPFFEPIPLVSEVEVRHFGLTYRFRPGAEPHLWLQERLIDDAWTLFCTYDLRPPELAVQQAAYQRHHTPGQSWVVGELWMVRCREDAVHAFRNGRYTQYTGQAKNVGQIPPEAWSSLGRDVFEIPELPVAEAQAALRDRAPVTGAPPLSG
jgi:arylamine N-acetyltransferase